MEEYLIKYSSETREMNRKKEKIYYLLLPKRDIYKKLIDSTNTKISLSSFYNLCGKNFKKPIKRTDLCTICENGQYLKKILGSKELSIQERTEIQSEFFLYEKHFNSSVYQRNKFNQQRKDLSEGSCIILMDFKQNIKLGGSLNETSKDFYNKTHLSVLGFCIIYKNNGFETRRYYSFISENLTHDSFFYKKAITWLLRNNKLSTFSNLSFWLDYGNHFRSAEMLYFIFREIMDEQFFFSIKMNYFTEYHGKNMVDGHFGVLTSWLKDGENTNEIKNIDQLINFFQEKTKRDDQKYEFIKFYTGEREKNFKKLVFKGYKNFLSYKGLFDKILYAPLTSDSEEKYDELSVLYNTVKEKRSTRMSIKRRAYKKLGPLIRASIELRYAAMQT